MKTGIYENKNGVRVKLIGSKRELGQTVYVVYFTNINDRSHFGLTKTGLKQFLKGFKKV
jgi:hypothetical protein